LPNRGTGAIVRVNLQGRFGRAVGLKYAVAWILSLLFVGPSVAQQRPAFEATVARVRIDVIVTDDGGRFVEGLGADDFVVFEDGEPQEVLAVELVGASTGDTIRAHATPGAAAIAPTAAAGESPIPAGDGEGRALVFLVDLPGMDWRNKTRFASAWEKLAADSDELGVPRAVYMIDQVGRLRELAPLTFDAERLREAAATVRAEPLVRKSTHDQIASGDPVDARAVSAAERARARATLEVLTQFCKALAAHGGRTALVWITSEVQITLAAPLDVGFTADLPFDAMAPDRLVSRRLEELYRAANSANVSIYTLDPTPAYELHGIGFDVESRSAARAVDLEGPVQFGLNGLRDALRSAAVETGGKSFIHWMDPAEALRAIETDTSRFYLLTYANPPPIGDGRYHEIRVEVKARNLTVRERSGYTDYPIDELDDRLLSGALNLPGTVGGAPLVAWALRKWSATGDPVLQIALRTPEGLATDVPEFELHGLAVGGDGELENTLEQRIREAPGLAPSPVYVHEWNLPPGSYDLHLVVRNPVNGELRAIAIPVEVPPPTSEWATSDIVLMVADGAGRPVPVFGDALVEDEDLAAYVEVVFGRDPVLSGDLFNAEGSEKIAQLPQVALQRGEDGIFRGALRMTGIPAGDYALQVAVTDAAARQHRVFRLPLRVRPR
jgi:VWFA-related protein